MSEEIANVTTGKHFVLFEIEARRLIELFGLKDWQVDFEHTKLNTRAACRFMCQGKNAVITLSTEWAEHEAVTDFKVRRSAFHEVCELLFADYYGAATDTDMSDKLREERLERETHTIIRRLENVVFPLL